jgi:hypothetical protein
MENLGKTGKDRITGLMGVITSFHAYLNDSPQYGIAPLLDKDGKFQEVHYFSVDRVEIS